jgi:glycosyltransferase involved in cell wall biosynthesis
MNPEISVIVPAYNEESYILDCLNSLVNQNFPKDKYEIMVVNNKSTDNTEKIIKQNFPNIKVVNEIKQGVVFARIKGVAEAKGEIIVFLDADSIAPKNWLSNLIMPYEDSSVVAVGGPYNYAKTKGQKKDLWTLINEKAINSGLHDKRLLGGNMSFRKKAYIECGGFSPKVNFQEDAYLSLKLKKLGKVIILKENFVFGSPRRITHLSFVSYVLKSAVNVLLLYLFGRTIFFGFKAVRKKSKN